MLNGEELANYGSIIGFLPENIQQHGIDLRVEKIERIDRCEGSGFIPAVGKTHLPSYWEIPLTNLSNGSKGWILTPGYYQVTFMEGCAVKKDEMLLIRQRSSLARCGGCIHSSIFDAGFSTENMGTFMFLFEEIQIEYGARIAQVYSHQTTSVEKLYDGQYQNDKQRKL